MIILSRRHACKYENRTVGAVLRTRDNVRPVFVSPGHLITLREAIYYTIRCTGKFRIPEPLRRADQLSKRVKKKLSDK
ncbi:MAG: endonuclease V [Nitrospirae bacterium]|nr:endonuclease V [Nitrospirota bacterium]